MARIGILTCSNCTKELDCASVVCLGDLRKRKGLFQQYKSDEPLDLIGIISCAGCPTINGQEKILRRVRSIVEFRIDSLHFSYCMTALCPFKERYVTVIQAAYPELRLVMGTHAPRDPGTFQNEVKSMLCASRFNMTDLIKGRTPSQ